MSIFDALTDEQREYLWKMEFSEGKHAVFKKRVYIGAKIEHILNNIKVKHIKDSITTEAIQWTGDNWEEIIEFVKSYDKIREYSDKLEIATPEGNLTASIGDYIIRGIKGEFYPCKPDIFELTYTALK